MAERRVPATLAFAAVLGVALALAGCKDSGLPGRNTPQAEAEQMEWSYPAYQASGAHAVTFGETEWMVAGPPLRIPADLLTVVGGEAGRELYALTTDAEPYSLLYQWDADGWTPLARVPVKTGEAVAH